MTNAVGKSMSRRKEEAWEWAMDEMACLLNEDDERKGDVAWAWSLVEELRAMRLPHRAIVNIGLLAAAAYKVGRRDEREGYYGP